MNRRTTRLRAAALLVAAPLAIGLAVGPAAHADPGPVTLTTGVQAPFHLTVGNDGNVYVADGGLSEVLKLNPANHHLGVTARGPQPGEVAGLAWNRTNTTLAYTSTSYATGKTSLTIRSQYSRVSVSMSGYESTVNPDAGTHYGLRHPNQCQLDAFNNAGIPAQYTGQVDSHPYAVASVGTGWVVADAAGNDLLKVASSGRISTLTVFPAQPITLTADQVSALGLPDCVVGATYAFEPVPTSVTPGPDGMLYVTTLPGGPEDPSLGARGSLYQVDPTTGAYTRLAGRFLGATDCAVAPNGDVYVAELFGGKVTRIVAGTHTRVTAAMVPGLASVAFGNGHLYGGVLAPTDDQGNPVPGGHGAIVQIF